MVSAAQIKSHVKSVAMRYSIRMLLRLLAFMLLPLSVCAAQFPLKSDAKLVVLVFISTECPISNKLAPEIERLSHKFPTNEVSFNLAYPNASDTDAKISAHRHDYKDRKSVV